MGWRGHCEGDLGGTESRRKPSENLGKKPGEIPFDGGIMGRNHSWAGGEYVFKIMYSIYNNNSNDS